MFHLGRHHLASAIAPVCILHLVLCLSPATAQFETHGSFPVTTEPSAIAIGDFNRDGKLDLAVTSRSNYTDTLTIMLGNGDGTFRQTVSYSAGVGAVSVVAADLNHDGNIDLAVASQSGYIGILIGNGDGTFQPPVQSPPVPTLETFVTVGDFNGDGITDLVALSANVLSVLLGNGDGTFQNAVTTAAPFSVQTIGIGDFNGDGKLDLATAGTFGSGYVHILLGNGDGSFQYGARYPGENVPSSIVVADFDGDHKLDLAISDLEGVGISVLKGKGDGTFEPAGRYSLPFIYMMTTADLNGDGKLDLVAAGQNITVSASQVTVLLGNGDGTFQPGTLYPVGIEAAYVAVGDLNHDGRKDLAVADELFDTVSVLMNTGVASFSPTTPLLFPAQFLGTASAPHTVTLTNSGANELSISSITASGPFQTHNTCGASVAPGASCDINISFTPTMTGQAAGLVKIIDSASSRPQFIEAFGEGTAIELSPAALNFQPQKVGTTSSPLPVKMTNQGSTAVFFYDIQIEGNNSTSFSQQNHCAKGLAPGGSCMILVSFTPNKIGPRHAEMLVGVTGGGSPRFLPLVGSGN